jgi:hypothetical protein
LKVLLFCLREKNHIYEGYYFAARTFRFDRKNIGVSKLKSPSPVRTGDKILPPKENILSTAALAGSAVLYLKKSCLIIG